MIGPGTTEERQQHRTGGSRYVLLHCLGDRSNYTSTGQDELLRACDDGKRRGMALAADSRLGGDAPVPLTATGRCLRL